MMEHLLISACLLGAQCRYDGQSKPVLEMVALSEQFDLVPLCPEQLGGLPTPRTPAERIEDRVMTKDGRDVTAEYRHGAEQALHLARLCGCKIALLKERSPSCGSGTIYDGTFTGGLTAGDGVTAALLRETDRTVLDIACQFGYDNASKFARAFRDVIGVSPREYRAGAEYDSCAPRLGEKPVSLSDADAERRI